MRTLRLVVVLGCAGVLWERVGGAGFTDEAWLIYLAFESKPECERTADTERRKNPTGELPIPGVPGLIATFHCLPDTIDPRAPKR